jgi:hypothetical protein
VTLRRVRTGQVGARPAAGCRRDAAAGADTALARRVDVPSIRLEEPRAGRPRRPPATAGTGWTAGPGARRPVSTSTSTTRPARAAHRRSLTRNLPERSPRLPLGTGTRPGALLAVSAPFQPWMTQCSLGPPGLPEAPARRPGSWFGAQQESQRGILPFLSGIRPGYGDTNRGVRPGRGGSCHRGGTDMSLWWIPVGIAAWCLIAVAVGLCIGPVLGRCFQVREAVGQQMRASYAGTPARKDRHVTPDGSARTAAIARREQNVTV